MEDLIVIYIKDIDQNEFTGEGYSSGSGSCLGSGASFGDIFSSAYGVGYGSYDNSGKNCSGAGDPDGSFLELCGFGKGMDPDSGSGSGSESGFSFNYYD